MPHNTFRSYCVFALFAVALAVQAPVVAAEFTADQITTITPLSAQAKAKIPKASLVPTMNRIFVKGVDDRQDIVPSKSGPQKQAMSVIRMPKKGILWAIIPSRKVYQERRVSPAGSTWTGMLSKMRPAGSEKVAGYDCLKYQKSFKEGGLPTTSTIWWSTRLAYPIKAASANSFVRTEVALRNIKEHPVSTSLFTVPKGYKRAPLQAAKPAARHKAKPKR